MKNFNLIVMLLLIIPIETVIFWVLLDPIPAYDDDNRELLWLLIALPILMANLVTHHFERK